MEFKFIKASVTWFLMLTQVLVALLPVSVLGENSSPHELMFGRTQIYTLSEGENAGAVAKKYNITLDELRQINQFRIFSHGLNSIRQGDELEVPFSKPISTSEDGKKRVFSRYASQLGSFLGSNPNSNAYSSLVRGVATGVANTEIQQWLSRFGTARVQLDTDNHFSFKNSQLDLLVPLYEKKENLIFTQGSLHRTDNREQVNLGAGIRHFTSEYMVGGNIFGDYDLSREHARMGFGAEYWRNFLKLSVNGYIRLSEWKDSPVLTDYEERPANGWDIRMQGWIPSLPELGGKLTLEQYYGQDVALFGTENLQKNPHAITAGINWTPVPLVTLAAEQRLGQSGHNDTRFSLGINYQLGVPWNKQIDPASVISMRSLSGRKYDLVDRNNNIVLEYKKKTVIQLHTVELIVGHAAEHKSLNVSVNSIYGLSHIEWDAGALIAAGGKIIQNGADWVAVLPNYQAQPQAVNTYHIYGVAIDINGNRSERSETQVTVLPPEVNKNLSTFTPLDSLLQADGKSTQILTLTLKNEHNQPVDMNAADIHIKNSALKTAKMSMLTRKSRGVYSITVTAGKDFETLNVTPEAQGIALKTASVVINNTVPDPAKSQFSALPDNIPADSNTKTTLTLVAKDAQGNALGSLQNNLTFVVRDAQGNLVSKDIITQSAVAESEQKGTYIATLKGGRAGSYTIFPEYNGTSIGDLSTKITFTSIAPSALYSKLNADKTQYTVGDDVTLTVTLVDTNNKPMDGQVEQLKAATMQLPGSTLTRLTNWTVGAGSGTYTATYRADEATTGKGTASLSMGTLSLKSGEYEIKAAGEPAQSTSLITVTGSSFTVGQSMTVSVSLLDTHGNGVAGQADKLTGAVTVAGATMVNPWTLVDGKPGLYQAEYTATEAGKALVATLKLTGWDGGVISDPYEVKAAPASQDNSKLNADKTQYTVGDDVTLTVTLVDTNNKPMDGQVEQLKAATMQLPGSTLTRLTNWTVGAGSGTYTATYRADEATTGKGTASLKLTGWNSPVQSSTYEVQVGQIIKIVTTAGNEYSPEQHFPKTGFKGASFKIQMNSDNGKFNFSISDGNNLASVSTDGVVTLSGKSIGHVSVLISYKGSETSGVKYDFTIERAYNIDSSVSAHSENYFLERCSQQGGGLVSLADKNDWLGGKFILSNDWGKLSLYKNGWEEKTVYAIANPEPFNESGNAYFLNVDTGMTGELLLPTAGMLCRFK
ncbi:inverse autotransporter beta domain-containing protein [Enterobacter asburiae]|uniref:inverse autotransporter beta domain-containing protein n=1 Tax=Enterobacter asburiae TaxID=61645 RepID=UPI001E45C8E7|nr:inverse autotransporter beta domain-containing protein [Enterobacter asburiae]MCE2004062.1 inverse autotransporter beta domain-containing protein [Enterobacter asburiae]